ncbi:hypothetical protein GQ53DRAFT_835043 [Thozetella sp. PMI_491]|nr:hypothetical protein GQ53DRAFT_835043 [Thozetella sp. PMI_491]
MAESNAPKLQVVMAVMIVVPFIFMSLRFFSRAKYGRTFAWDDAVLLLSWLLHVAYCGVIIAATKYGIGQHISDVKHEDLVISLKCLYMGNFFVIMAISISKTSFAMTLLGLAVKKWHFALLWFSIVSVNIIMGIDAIFQFTQCTPVQKTWDTEIPGRCWDSYIVIYYSMFAGAWSALMDFVLAGVPWLLLWGVRMKTAEKVGLVIAMSLGIFSGITACIKTAYLPDLGRWTDLTFSTPDLLMWAAAETMVIIIGASLPFLRKLIREIFFKKGSSSAVYATSHNLDGWNPQKTAITGGTSSKPEDLEATSGDSDDTSDKSILGDVKAGQNGILVTQHFAVTRHGNSRDGKEAPKGDDTWGWRKDSESD